MKRCFIFSAGTFYGLYERPQEDDFVIAADAGYLTAERLHIQPQLIVGDFDSAPKPEGTVPCEVYPIEKDDTDTMAAIRRGLAMGCTEFFLYGATGGSRMDHTLANIQALAFLKNHGAQGYLYDHKMVYTAICNEHFQIPHIVPNGTVSVFCMTDVAAVSNTGLKYPLNNARLRQDYPVGVSNQIVGQSAAVSVKDGMLLVGWEIEK